MNESTLGTAAPPAARQAPPAAVLACMELDRFCEECGYNLRTLLVVREPHTGIPVVRCTECGRFQPANNGATALRPWLGRATALLLVAWILALVGVLFLSGLGLGALSYATLDELTVHGGAITTRTIAGTTIRTWTTMGPLTIKTDYEHYVHFMTAVLITSLASAFAIGMFAVVACPHWRRGAYTGFMLAIPIATGAIVALCWRHEAPHLFEWGVRYMMAHTGVQLLGGLMGVNFGRAVARTAVRVFLPPSARPRLAFLWLADNKPFPRA